MPIVPDDYLESISKTDVLENFEPQDETGLLVENIGAWPAALQPLLIVYERWCLRAIEFVWHRSLLQWMIRH